MKTKRIANLISCRPDRLTASVTTFREIWFWAVFSSRYVPGSFCQISRIHQSWSCRCCRRRNNITFKIKLQISRGTALQFEERRWNKRKEVALSTNHLWYFCFPIESHLETMWKGNNHLKICLNIPVTEKLSYQIIQWQKQHWRLLVNWDNRSQRIWYKETIF